MKTSQSVAASEDFATADPKPLFSRALIKFELYWMLIITSAKDRNRSASGIVVGGLLHLFRIAIFASMFRLAFNGGQSPIYSVAVWSVAISQGIYSLDRPQLCVTIGEDIKSGNIEISLLRPLNYLHLAIAMFLGRSFPSLCINSIFSIFAGLLFTGDLPGDINSALAMFLVIPFGIAVVVLLSALLGTFGFWTTDTTSFAFLDQKILFLFGGLIIPIILLPDTVQKYAFFTPWSAATALPAKVITSYSTSLFLSVIAVQIFWIAFLYLASGFFLKRGVKRLTSIGG